MRRLPVLLFVSAALAVAACSDPDEGPAAVTTDEGPVTVPVDDDAGADEDDTSDEEDQPDSPPSEEETCVSTGPDGDADEDGFPEKDDCNDCSPQINPGAYDFPGDEWDEDCSGEPAQAAVDNCDVGLSIGSTDAKDAARALGLCKFVAGPDDKSWGVLDARFTNSTGSGGLQDPLQVGLPDGFGAAKPRQGEAILALSSC